MFQNGITSLHNIVIYQTFWSPHHVTNLLQCCCNAAAMPLHSHSFLKTLTTPWYEALMITCLPFHNTPKDLIILYQPVQFYDTWSIHTKFGQELIICHVQTIMQHSFPIDVPLPTWDTIAMTSTQSALLICNNQCHPQSYTHHQSKKSRHKPLQPDFLLYINILLSRLPF